MKNLFSVKDKVVLITGAAGILGNSMVHHFSEQGAKVVILDRNEEAGKALEKAVTDKGHDAWFLYTDVLNKDVLRKNYDDILAKYGRIDVLINGAGGNMPGATIAPDKTIFDLDTEAFKKVVDLNLFGT
ncbi:MAG: SDR family NAD(P)-dependent oxidoreductase, partial [Dysgonamonadaceae bacterium]|nr:SDR family NAD(P)-dependent oxidoreductase [Dysgonamonadaceae bacterium]